MDPDDAVTMVADQADLLTVTQAAPVQRIINIVVPIGCRSDRGLTEPIITALERIPLFNVITVSLAPDDLHLCRALMRSACHAADMVLCVADRQEMLAAATVAFEMGKPIGHVYSGILNSIGTRDDIARHIITLMSDIQFCESSTARNITISLMQRVGLKPNAYDVGITHFDDAKIDESYAPNRDYRVVLYNPVTRGTPAEALATTTVEMHEICMMLDKEEMFTYVIGPNPDMEFDYQDLLARADVFRPNLDRPKFLGLLSRAKQFITNSSAAIYEAPVVMKRKDREIIHIGLRNRGRFRGPFRTGASKRIAYLLSGYATQRFLESGVEKAKG